MQEAQGSTVQGGACQHLQGTRTATATAAIIILFFIFLNCL